MVIRRWCEERKTSSMDENLMYRNEIAAATAVEAAKAASYNPSLLYYYLFPPYIFKHII